MQQKSETVKCCYFVDEAGDGTLFNPRGKVIIGTPGCSRFFILGMLQVDDPTALAIALHNLRKHLLADPYFKDVPSMQPWARKTALAFHAKDDPQEVRRDAFELLHGLDGLRFFAVVHDKQSVLDYVRDRNAREPAYRYNANELYDFMVRRLLRDRLHQYGEYEITFSKRGKSDRTEALHAALNIARKRFEARQNISSNAPITITASTPPLSGCLQAADYFNWALQRLFEQGEDRFVIYLWDKFRLVVDMDDTRKAEYGAYYNKKRPLTRAALEGH
ncbi:MAG: DUF3800 domain-containing protein [Anaerolineales bacterium]|jgi:hypothetical protein